MSSQDAGSRRAGYVVAVAINLALLVALNSWPGWDAVPFLTDETTRVLGWVNASLVVSALANVAYVVADPRWLKAAGDAVTTGVGLVAMLRLWSVFPFAFAAGSVDWALVVRVVLVVGIVGSAIGIVAAVVRLVAAAAHTGPVARPRVP